MRARGTGGHSFFRSSSMSSDGLKVIIDAGHDARCMVCEPASFYSVHEWTFPTYPDVHVSLQFTVVANLQRDWRKAIGLKPPLQVCVLPCEDQPPWPSGVTQPPAALCSFPPSTTLSGNTVVPSSTVLSFLVKIISFRAHFGLVFLSPNGRSGHVSRLCSNKCCSSHYDSKCQVILCVPISQLSSGDFFSRLAPPIFGWSLQVCLILRKRKPPVSTTSRGQSTSATIGTVTDAEVSCLRDPQPGAVEPVYHMVVLGYFEPEPS